MRRMSYNPLPIMVSPYTSDLCLKPCAIGERETISYERSRDRMAGRVVVAGLPLKQDNIEPVTDAMRGNNDTSMASTNHRYCGK